MVNFIKKMKATEFAMRLREKIFLYRNYDPATTTHFIQAMKRFKECENLKNRSQIKREIQVCKDYWKCFPYHYYIYDLFRADNHLTNEELINFIPHFYWDYLFLPHHNSQKFSLLGENKIIIEHFFKALTITQPKTICIFLNHYLYSSHNEQISFNQVWNEIQSHDIKKIFVKPADGAGGKGIYIFHKNDEGSFVTRENINFNENFLTTIGKNNDYIIQAGITQDHKISEIYPDSVNTCRIITENKNGVVRLVCAMLRIGRDQQEVDNISSGGICVNIDISSGKFGNFAISYAGKKFAQHPDTHFVFRNVKISRWDEIRKFATESAGRLPFFTYLGWDVALTDGGPVAIEINRSPAIDVMEMTSGGLRKAFGISDPDYYWKNPGKRI